MHSNFVLRGVGIAKAYISAGFFRLVCLNQTAFFLVSNSLLFYLNAKLLIVTASIKQMITTLSLQNEEKKQDV